VVEIQRRLGAVGFLGTSFIEPGYFCEFTQQALRDFQTHRGLLADGICDRNTWDSLIESSWYLGARLLYLTAPHQRGDDVIALQTKLATLGFDCGRIDGVLGPESIHSLTDFQHNYGLIADGICGAETLQALDRMSTQTGSGPGIVSVREFEKLHQSAMSADSPKIVVGCFGSLQEVSRALTRQLRERYDDVLTVEESDTTLHAHVANSFQADVYIGVANSCEQHHEIAFYETEGFSSPGGRRLAYSMAEEISGLGLLPCFAKGMRLPILRATRMPAVVCTIGSSSPPTPYATLPAICVAIETWFEQETN